MPAPLTPAARAWAWLVGRYGGADLVLLALGLAALAVVAVVDPRSGSLPGCPIRAWTGLSCAGCGGTRALHALLHGDVGRAWAFNPLATVLMPLGALWFLWRPALPARAPAAVAVVVVAVAIVFTVGRNL
jgi:hypothetical protein